MCLFDCFPETAHGEVDLTAGTFCWICSQEILKHYSTDLAKPGSMCSSTHAVSSSHCELTWCIKGGRAQRIETEPYAIDENQFQVQLGGVAYMGTHPLEHEP